MRRRWKDSRVGKEKGERERKGREEGESAFLPWYKCREDA